MTMPEKEDSILPTSDSNQEDTSQKGQCCGYDAWKEL